MTADALQESLLAASWVRQASASGVTSTLLLKFDRTVAVQEVVGEVDRHVAQAVLLTHDDAGRHQSPLEEALIRAQADPGQLAAALGLTIGAHSLHLLQSLSFITTVNIAAGDSPRVLRWLGIADTRRQLRFVTMATIVLMAGELSLQFRRRKAWEQARQAAEHALRVALFAHILDQDLAFHDAHDTSKLITLLTGDVSDVGACIEWIDLVVQSVMTVIVYGTEITRASPRLAVIAAAVLPLVVLPRQLAGPRVTAASASRGTASAGLSQAVENVLAGIVEVKSFNAEGREVVRVRHVSARLRDASLDATAAATLQDAGSKQVFFAGHAVAIGVGADRAASGRLARDRFVRAVFWFPRLITALGELSRSTYVYHDGAAAAQRIAKVMKRESTTPGGSIRLDPADCQGDLSVEHVSFGYARAVPVLRDVTVHVRPGATLGLVGPTGSGKSTLMRLLMRLYDPDSGKILLDGRDIKTLDAHDLRASVAFVSQDSYLFDGTIWDNLRYGRPDLLAAGDHDLSRLGEIGVLLAELLGELAGDLGAPVGERGRRLSGGQRQRISIGRALLTDAPILALDEATSHLDYATEEKVRRVLERSAAGKTIILISHRLSSVRHADNIAVLERGAIREQGSHDTLLALGGIYYGLWKLQV